MVTRKNSEKKNTESRLSTSWDLKLSYWPWLR